MSLLRMRGTRWIVNALRKRSPLADCIPNRICRRALPRHRHWPTYAPSASIAGLLGWRKRPLPATPAMPTIWRFSGQGDFERVARRFAIHVCTTAVEEGFSVQHRKTRRMQQGVRQHLAGLVVNERLNVRRSDFDRLKAILTNCIRSGPQTQNRGNHADFRAHLQGRLSFIEQVNPNKGRRLRTLFGQIQW